VNWDKPRREWRTCPVCGVSFEVDSGSRRKYDKTKCQNIAWHRRSRKARQAWGNKPVVEVDAGELIRRGIAWGVKGMK